MKRSTPITRLIAAVFCLCTVPLYAQAESSYLGVQLSAQPLPQLLARHLQLEPGRGVLIQNVLVASPADRAGLDRDDIILELNARPVTDYRQFSEAIANTPPGQSIVLTVLQAGTRNTITVTPAPRPADTQPGDWKYPPQVESSHIWRPGRIFRLDPEHPNMEIPELPENFDDSMADLIANLTAAYSYQYRHGSGDDIFTVIIRGNPEKADTPVTVNAGHEKHQATVGTVDQLPEQFRPSVRDDIEKSKAYKIDFGGREINQPGKHNFSGEPLHDNEPDGKTAELEKKIEQLQQQMKQMQQQWEEKFETLEKKLTQKRELHV